MPVHPGEYHKMKPNMEYAMYYDGENGKTVTYYSRDAQERTVQGEAAKKAYNNLQNTWERVEASGTPEGMYVFFKREKLGKG